MSTFYLKNTTASEPKPNDKQNTDVVDFGSYGVQLDMTLTTNSGSNNSRVFPSYVLGTDDNTHFSYPITWITPPLTGGSFNGASNAYLTIKLSTLPDIALIYSKAALYIWNYLTDNLQELVGTYYLSTNLDNNFVEYNFAFGSDTVTWQDQDRFYLEVWLEVHDNTGDQSGVNTPRLWYNSTTYNSRVTIPGTQTAYVAPGSIMMKNKIGIFLN